VGPILFHNIVDTCTIASLSITLYRLRRQGKWPQRPTPPSTPPVLPPTDMPPGKAPTYV
jgi:hypothetical protein